METDEYSAINPDFKISCVGCTTSGMILVRAAFDLDTALIPDVLSKDDSNSSNGGGGDGIIQVDAALLEVEILDDLRARANIEVFAGAASQLVFSRSLLPMPLAVTPIQVGGILSIGPIFDFEVELGIQGPSASINFTVGRELVVPKGAKATLDYGPSNKTGATGW